MDSSLRRETGKRERKKQEEERERNRKKRMREKGREWKKGSREPFFVPFTLESLMIFCAKLSWLILHFSKRSISTIFFFWFNQNFLKSQPTKVTDGHKTHLNPSFKPRTLRFHLSISFHRRVLSHSLFLSASFLRFYLQETEHNGTGTITSYTLPKINWMNSSPTLLNVVTLLLWQTFS